MDQLAHMPLYLRLLIGAGALGFLWKLVQGRVPDFLAFLEPLALRLTDGFVALIMAQPLLRWIVLGDEENFLKTVNALLDGLERISNAVQKRLKQDLDAAAGRKPEGGVSDEKDPAPPAAPQPPTPAQPATGADDVHPQP